MAARVRGIADGIDVSARIENADRGRLPRAGRINELISLFRRDTTLANSEIAIFIDLTSTDFSSV